MWYGPRRAVNYEFSASQVSKLDYFHPSRAGQAALAFAELAAAPWGSLDFLRRLALSRSGLSEVVVANI
jgi:hypothetical protein